MSRAQGRQNPQRRPKNEDIDPDSREGHDLGLSKRVQGHPSPIPGGQNHRSNAPALRHTVPVPDSEPEIGKGNAHGVIPGSHTNEERADAMRGPNTVHRTMPRPQQHTPADRPHPIPVFIVQDHDQDVLRTAAPRHITVPGNTADPVRLCGRDSSRTAVHLLNESTAQDIRFAQTLADLTNGGGALLPWPVNSYQKFETQDELWALSTSATAATVSVVQVFERGM